MIEVREITVRYPGADTDALQGVSLAAPPGQLTALVGPNGSGKSTLVRALLGRAPVTTGSIQVGGQDLLALAERPRAQRLAVVVQREEPAFPMAVRDYVALGRHPWRGTWDALTVADESQVMRAMQDADLGALVERRTDTLSGGEWQRVRLARALAQDTPALVLDEPTTFLDISHEMACFELLATLARGGRAVLVVSHHLNLVARFADMVGVLSRGRLAAFGPPAEVMRGEVLEPVYDWPLVVTRDAASGAPTLVPLRRRY